jgi:hypothetical protein
MDFLQGFVTLPRFVNWNSDHYYVWPGCLATRLGKATRWRFSS